MTPEQLDELGEIADYADNLSRAALLPMPPSFHVDQLSLGMQGICARARALYVAVCGEDPWSDAPEGDTP